MQTTFQLSTQQILDIATAIETYRYGISSKKFHITNHKYTQSLIALIKSTGLDENRSTIIALSVKKEIYDQQQAAEQERQEELEMMVRYEM